MYRRDVSYSEVWKDEMPESTIGIEEGVKASLECPRTEAYTLETNTVKSPAEAVRDLGNLAAEAVCVACPYSRMTRAEVYAEQAETLRAQTAKIEAETAYHKALEAGRAVLQGITKELEDDRQRAIDHIGELRALEERIHET